MQYKFMSNENVIQALLTRQLELEQDHLRTSILLEEAGVLESHEEVKAYRFTLASLEYRHGLLEDKIKSLTEKLEEESEEVKSEESEEEAS